MVAKVTRFLLTVLIPTAGMSIVLECPEKCVVVCVNWPNLIHGCAYYIQGISAHVNMKFIRTQLTTRQRFPGDLQPDVGFLLTLHGCKWKGNPIPFSFSRLNASSLPSIGHCVGGRNMVPGSNLKYPGAGGGWDGVSGTEAPADRQRL